MPSMSTLKAVFWSVAAVAIIARVPMASDLVFGK